MIIQLNKNLILEVSRWKREYTKLGSNNKNRIQNSSFRKSDKDLTKGLDKGTDNILNQARAKGYKIKESDISPDSFVVISPVSKHILFSPGRYDDKLEGAISKRHEAYEVQTHVNNHRNKGDFHDKGVFGGKGLHRGQHNSGIVLSNEAKVLNDLSYTSSTKPLRDIRSKTHEYDTLKKITGIDMDNVNSKNIRKVNKKLLKWEAKNNYIHDVPLKQSISDLGIRAKNAADPVTVSALALLGTAAYQKKKIGEKIREYDEKLIAKNKEFEEKYNNRHNKDNNEEDNDDIAMNN